MTRLPATLSSRVGIAVTLVALALPGSFTACAKTEAPQASGGQGAGARKLQIVATTGMVADLARQLGGDQVEVVALMGPGVDPHLYKARAGDVDRMLRADVVLYNGLHLEGAMGEVFAKIGTMGGDIRVAAVGDALSPKSLMGHGEGKSHDPHIWFDVSLWRQTIPLVKDTLAAAAPGLAETFEANARRYGATLDALHQEILAAVASIPKGQRVLITAHDAFEYFGRAYGLEVRGLQGISTSSEAGAGDVRDLATFIVERRVAAIFVESSVSPRTIEAVKEAVRARGFQVRIGGELYSDALGTAGGPAADYVGMVRSNTAVIVEALGGVAVTTEGGASAPTSPGSGATP